jgi:hypothetical protein
MAKMLIAEYIATHPGKDGKKLTPRKVRTMLSDGRLKGEKVPHGVKKQKTWFVFDGEEAPPPVVEQEERPSAGNSGGDGDSSGGSGDIDSGDGGGAGGGDGAPGDSSAAFHDTPGSFADRVALAEEHLGVGKGAKSKAWFWNLKGKKSREDRGDPEEEAVESKSSKSPMNADSRFLSKLLKAVLGKLEPWISSDSLLTDLWFDCSGMILEGWALNARNSKWWGFCVSSAGIFGSRFLDKVRSSRLHRKRKVDISEGDAEEGSVRQAGLDLHTEEERRVSGQGNQEFEDDSGIDLPEY